MIRWRGGNRSIHPAGLSHRISVGAAIPTAPAATSSSLNPGNSRSIAC